MATESNELVTTIPPADAPVTTPTAPTAARNRPTGITLVALLALISGVLGICGVLPIVGISLVGAIIPTGVTQVLGALGLLFAGILALGPILQLFFAYGAWNLRGWAWWLGLAATGISVVGALGSIIVSGGAAFWTAVTNALLPIVIFVYLLTPGVRKVFRV